MRGKAGLFAALCASATAYAHYHTSYTVSLNTGQPVTNIMMLERGDGWGGATWAYQASGTGETEIINPFNLHDPVTRSLLIGIVQGLPGDANPEQKHVVLFMSDAAADLSLHIAWGTLFRNTVEEGLIAGIELATSGLDWPLIEPGLTAVNDFANGDAEHGVLGPGGVEVSAWFAMGDTFSVMTWSEGELVGAGVSHMGGSPSVCPGDLDGSLIVDIQDLAVMLGNYGSVDAAPEDGDVDGDGDVDIEDLAALLANFGSLC